MKQTQKNCPICGNTVSSAANICMICGYDFDYFESSPKRTFQLPLFLTGITALLFGAASFFFARIAFAKQMRPSFPEPLMTRSAGISVPLLLCAAAFGVWAFFWLRIARQKGIALHTRAAAGMTAAAVAALAVLAVYSGFAYASVFGDALGETQKNPFLGLTLPNLFYTVIFVCLVVFFVLLIYDKKQIVVIETGITAVLLLLLCAGMCLSAAFKGSAAVVHTFLIPLALCFVCIALSAASMFPDKTSWRAG